MAKKDEQKSITKDVFIEDVIETVESKPVTRGSFLKIPFADTSTDKALRIFDEKGNQLIFVSTRTKTLEAKDGNYLLDVSGNRKELVGKNYDLRNVGTKEIVLTGKIVEKESASKAAQSQAS